MRGIIGTHVPHLNKSPPAPSWELTQPQRAWVRSFYENDFDDPAIALAIQGQVLRRSGKSYVVVGGSSG